MNMEFEILDLQADEIDAVAGGRTCVSGTDICWGYQPGDTHEKQDNRAGTGDAK